MILATVLTVITNREWGFWVLYDPGACELSIKWGRPHPTNRDKVILGPRPNHAILEFHTHRVFDSKDVHAHFPSRYDIDGARVPGIIWTANGGREYYGPSPMYDFRTLQIKNSFTREQTMFNP
jgi:hypothetical protein